MLLVFVVCVLLILGLLGFALSTQTESVHTDAEILVARLVALGGARNAIAETIPIFTVRVNRYHMRIKLPPSYDAGSASAGVRLSQNAGSRETDYQRFLSRYDDSPHFAADTIAPGPLEPTVVSGVGGLELDFPEDPLYAEFRRSPRDFEAELPAALSRRIYLPYGSRAWVDSLRVKVLSAHEDGEFVGAVSGMIAFTGECSVVVRRLTVRRALQVRRRFRLISAPQPLPAMAEPGPSQVLTLDDAPSCEMLVTPHGEGGSA